MDLKSIDFKNIDLRDFRTQVIILIVLFSLIAFVLYLYFVFVPQVTRVAALIGKTVRIRGELISAKELVAQEGSVKKKLEDYEEKVNLYEKKLPAEQEIPNLLENLSNMAKEANITIVGITPSFSYFKERKPKASQAYQEIPILITARSGYHELGNFLANLENADRFIKVVDISIKANKASPRRHDIELMVCTYILSPEK